jgi:chemotaxis protein CheX
MQAEHINPFLSSLKNTFSTMLACEVRRGDLRLKNGESPSHPISGVIGLSGKAVGTVVINLSESVALKAASVMLLSEMTEVNEDVLDAVGEIANMVAGAAKSELEQYELSVSLPNVVVGDPHAIHFPSNATPICVPYDTDWGPLNLEVGLEAIAEPVAT